MAPNFEVRILVQSVLDRGHVTLLEFLIAKWANGNAKDIRGKTPLDIAHTRSQKNVINLLKNNNALDLQRSSIGSPPDSRWHRGGPPLRLIALDPAE
jgi:ankyrin repeat protein